MHVLPLEEASPTSMDLHNYLLLLFGRSTRTANLAICAATPSLTFLCLVPEMGDGVPKGERAGDSPTSVNLQAQLLPAGGASLQLLCIHFLQIDLDRPDELIA